MAIEQAPLPSGPPPRGMTGAHSPMRRFHFGAALSVVVSALTLLPSWAHAQACVEYKGLPHCALGSARLTAAADSLQVQNASTLGKDGVAIHTGSASSWIADSFIETDDSASNTVLTSVSAGAVTSTASITQDAKGISYASAFAGSGKGATYTVAVYYKGAFQASVSGVSNHVTGVISHPSLSYQWSPSCRPIGQSYSQCMNTCHRYGTCDFCSRPCRTGIHWNPTGVKQSFSVPYPELTLANGQTVIGDELVVSPDAPPASSAPINEVRIQTTAKTTTLTQESVVQAR